MTQLNTNAPDVSVLMRPEVRCLPDAVVIEHIIVRDRTVVDYFATAPEDRRTALAADAFVLGTRALASAAGSATMAALNDHLESAVRSAAQNLALIPGSVSQQIEGICKQYLGEGGVFPGQIGKDLQAIEAALGPNGNTLAEIRNALAAEVTRRVSEAMAPVIQALNVNDEGGPLGLINRNLQGLMSGQVELREQIGGAVRLHAQRDVSIHKGYDLENFVSASLGALASHIGDRFEDCSLVPGLIPNNKAGDFVSVIDPRLTHGTETRIAVEAKNRKSDTVTSLCRLLDTVKENRGARIVIGILANPTITTRPISMYGPDKIIVHLEAFGAAGTDEENYRTLLEMAYYIARLQAAALVDAALDSSFDPAFISECLDRIEAAVANFKTLNCNLTAIETAVEKTRNTADSMRDGIKDIANDLKTMFSKTASTPAIQSAQC